MCKIHDTMSQGQQLSCNNKGHYMRKLLIVTTMVLGSWAMAEDCAPITKGGKTLYPISDAAKEVSEATNLKTCNRSPRFASAFKDMHGKTYDVVNEVVELQ